nr:hypothetical protein [uncultured Rhodoferax sp.]
MQLPTIERNPNLRPAGADSVSSGAQRVIPVAPVNPSASATSSIESTPDVIDKVNPALKPQPSGEAPYQSAGDPMLKGTEAAAQKDWTIHRPEPEKVEDPVPKPISQVLMDHLKTVWTASATAVQIEQANNQVSTPAPVSPTEAPGQLSKQALVYSPSKIKKTENL